MRLDSRDLSHSTQLTCLRCGQIYPSDYYQTCARCNEPLLLDHDLKKISHGISKSTFRGRSWGVWRYLELLPRINKEKVISLGEGGTALLRCERLARALGL